MTIQWIRHLGTILGTLLKTILKTMLGTIFKLTGHLMATKFQVRAFKIRNEKIKNNLVKKVEKKAYLGLLFSFHWIKIQEMTKVIYPKYYKH